MDIHLATSAETPPELPAGVEVQTVYHDFLSYLLEKTKIRLFELHPTGIWDTLWGRAEIVMAHPNRWGDRQQRVLDAAAISTGLISAARAPTGLFFLEEGEAAASFCATRPELRKDLQVRFIPA